MTQNTKTTLMIGGAIVLVSGIAYLVYKSKINKLPIVVNDGTETAEEETTPKSINSNPFTLYVNNPLPSSIGYTFGSANTGLK
jgi:hypothetical protein